MLDVDGVLTDGSLWFGARGEQLKRFHVRDGHGIQLLAAAGVQVAVISGRRSAAVTARCRELGIAQTAAGCCRQEPRPGQAAEKTFIARIAGGCIGDDTPDIPLFDARGGSR